ncbi:restriction endonuclease [Pseudoxanthomonas daejeonensis]|uniref:restriction endonuclease n=1 Tax=Pseudoxanthomonas daejeonensis TaxID=266062 RepID=UPI001F5483AE|nr:restriction endonuclease [Pseudoxanthomonas daejeonensis]UNK57101.1 restriction endonuclease [Pseudoxanthomonas daejeonensis]
MSSWILGLGLAALAAVLAVLYIWLVRRPETETAAGLRALANLRWREFATIIGQAMQQRGLRDANQGLDQGGDSTSSQLLMTDGDSRWLLSCKHGMAYRLGEASVEELAGAMDLAGARGGILLTEGHAERDALAAAAARGIEVIDGRRLWPLLKPFLPVDVTQRIETAAKAQAKRHTSIALGGALALGLVVAVLLPRLESAATETPAVTAATAPSGPAGTQKAVAAPAATEAPAVDESVILDNPDDATFARYQGDIARTLSVVPGITRAYWLTRATLVIDRSGSDQMVWPLICSELERYPPLRNVRVQLNPRPGSEDAVRWRQCRTM